VAATATIEIRSPTEDELPRFVQAVMTAFLETANEHDEKMFTSQLDPEHQYWALDGDVPVGTAGTYDIRMRVPGGELPVAGVTLVGVHPSHRRRGILTQMMRRQLDDAHERGEPIAVLWASEASIYGRFGYGVASASAGIEAERDRMVFRPPDEASGRARLISEDEAARVIPPIYERIQQERPGMVRRSESWFTSRRLADPEHWRGGGGPLYRAVWEDDSLTPQAYALYRYKGEWDGGLPSGTLQIREALGTTPEATREIWRFLFGVDLVTTVSTWLLPPDHPLFLSVTEPRRLHFRVGDGIWVRLLDIPAAFGGRSYAAEGSVGFDVRDPFCNWNDGTWTLRAEGGAGTVERGGKADLRLDVSDLGSTFLGGWTFAELERAGRVEELAPGAVERADALFRTGLKPWCPEIF
jgi:predicted acetyltransferase